MKQLQYQLRFLTPAFLGNAEQSAQWRTPPIKALLRQWWRVVYAAENGFAVRLDEMRHEEGRLFGHAWLEDDSFERDGRRITTAGRKSLVRLRLYRWDEGNLKKAQWPADEAVTHPEVKNREGRAVPVGSELYLGYGPLTYDNQRRATSLKANAAIQAGESAAFAVACPTTHDNADLKALAAANAPRLERALWLLDRFGTLGGRSRNGWGSFALTPQGQAASPVPALPLRPWRACLDRDWPHAIGGDDKGPLIWQTALHDDWQSLMKTLAIVKIGLRTQKPQLEFRLDPAAGDKPTRNGINHGRPQPRHWLSYPVTNHSVDSWGNQARLPNSLRFKVRANETGKLVGVIFHMPCLPPKAFAPDKTAIEDVWARVHEFLDSQQPLTRSNP
jgi:CRISPR-associated protein Cmr1